MRIRVHVQGVKGSGTVKPGEEAAVMFNGILEVNGHMIEEVGTIEVLFGGGEIMQVKPHLMPGLFEVVTHDSESWPALLAKIDEDRKATSGAGRLIAVVED